MQATNEYQKQELEEFICLFCGNSFYWEVNEEPVCPQCGTKHDNVASADEEEEEEYAGK